MTVKMQKYKGEDERTPPPHTHTNKYTRKLGAKNPLPKQCKCNHKDNRALIPKPQTTFDL